MNGAGTLLLVLALGGQPPPGAAISGRVVDQASGRPVPRMIVSAVPDDRRQPVEARTDEDGRYEISGLPPGSYGLKVTHDEHRATYLAQWYGASAPGALMGAPPPFRFELQLNERRTGIDVALTRGLAIEGRITDPWGDPLADAEVTVLRSQGPLAGSEVVADDQGNYRAFGLAPGRYRVCVRPSQSIPSGTRGDAPTLVRTCYPAAGAHTDASEVVLTSQDVADIDIRVQRVGGRSIAGTVVDAAGVPTDGARVTASPSDRTSPSANATTRAGAFVLKGLVPGAYTVRAMIGGTTPGDPDPPARDRELATVAVDVGAVDAVNVMLALAKAATIRGSVVFEGGPPPSAAASRMTVAVIPLHESGWPFWLPPPQAKVRDDLTFDLADVFRMPIAVAVQGLPQDLALKAIRYGGRDITYVPTDFTAGPPARLELVLTSEIAHLTIRVAHARGEETRTAIPIVLPADPSRWKLPYLTAPEEKTDGTLTFGALLPGDYLVAALSTDDYSMLFQDPSRFEAVARIATRVTLGKHDRQTLTIGVVPLPNK